MVPLRQRTAELTQYLGLCRRLNAFGHDLDFGHIHVWIVNESSL